MQTSERSGLEQDLGQTVTLVKAKRAAQAGQGEAQLYAGDPYGMPPAAPGQPLPAPPVSAPLLPLRPYCVLHLLYLPLYTLFHMLCQASVSHAVSCCVKLCLPQPLHAV